MTTLFVDADACPVKDEALKVAGRHRLAVYLVSNRWMRVEQTELVKSIAVPEGPDAADDWIAERVGPADVVVTGDIPLAGRCLARGAQVLNHTGKPFTPDSIGMALAMRDLMSHLRDTGEVSGGGPSFSKQDRSRFLSALESAVQAAQRR